MKNRRNEQDEQTSDQFMLMFNWINFIRTIDLTLVFMPNIVVVDDDI